jgi:Zn finger protein HypA/HybF involved in hydrogenase expression
MGEGAEPAVTGLGESYTCERCGGTFIKVIRGEEALAEARDLFPADHIAAPEDQATVCDPCFREIMAWAETSAPDLLRDPPAVSDDPIGDAVRADAEAARQEIRESGYGQLACPSCGKPAADILGTGHCLILNIDGDTPWCECRDGAQVLLGSLLVSRIGPAKAWEKMQAAVNIFLADGSWFLDGIAFAKIIGTGPANFTGLLSVLERP